MLRDDGYYPVYHHRRKSSPLQDLLSFLPSNLIMSKAISLNILSWACISEVNLIILAIRTLGFSQSSCQVHCQTPSLTMRTNRSSAVLAQWSIKAVAMHLQQLLFGCGELLRQHNAARGNQTCGCTFQCWTTVNPGVVFKGRYRSWCSRFIV